MKDANGNEIIENVTEGQETPPASQTPIQPPIDQTKSTDWESQYKGLQGTYNKLFTGNADLTNKYAALVEEHEKTKQDLARVSTELSQSQVSLGEKEKSILEKQTSVEAKAREYDRLKTIAMKYPMLVNLELNGLIPDLKPEELNDKLQILNDTIARQIDDRTADTLKNVPPGSTQFNNQIPPVNDIDSVYTRLNQLAGSRDPADQAEFQRLSDLYVDLKNKK